MGHKVSPTSWRIGYIKNWKSVGYFDKKEYVSKVSSDALIRDAVIGALKGIPLGNIFIAHEEKNIRVTIYSSRTTLVLGKSGENITKLEKNLVIQFQEKFIIEVKEVKNPETYAALIADSIARQIERRLPYRRVIKQTITKSLEKGVGGIKVIIAGRLNGADIARRETYKEGNIPNQTIRANIDYVTERANTIYGVIGIKVWIYKGDIKK